MSADPRAALEAQIRPAAVFHVQKLRDWWLKIPESSRAELAGYITNIIVGAERLQKLMPKGVSPMEAAGPAQQLYGLLKGFTGAGPVIAAVLKSEIPDLAPLADALAAP